MIEQHWPFYYGGIAIALVAIAVLAIGGDYIGITRGYVSLCSIITKKPAFHKPELGGTWGHRTMFVLGVILGGFLAAVFSGNYSPNFQLGRFDKIWGNSMLIKLAVLVFGGFLWGYGSRMAKGCTSGNAIAGMSRGSLASIVATIGFMIGGISVIQILNLFLGGN